MGVGRISTPIFSNMKLLIAIVILGLCIFGMCFNIIFKKDGKFPDGEISHNKYLRDKGVICAKEEEFRIWKNGGRKPTDKPHAHPHDGSSCPEGGCEGCAYFSELEKRNG